MDAIIEESTFAQYIKELGIEEGIKKGRKEGREEGIEQGLEQGIEQGERRSTLANLLDVLEIRFGDEVHALSDRLNAIDDVQHLKRLHRAAIQASDLDEFERMFDSA